MVHVYNFVIYSCELSIAIDDDELVALKALSILFAPKKSKHNPLIYLYEECEVGSVHMPCNKHIYFHLIWYKFIIAVV